MSGFDFGDEPDPPVLIMNLYAQPDRDVEPVRHNSPGKTKADWEGVKDTALVLPARSGDNLVSSKFFFSFFFISK